MAYRRTTDAVTGKPSEAGVVRLEDGAFVPADPANTDWQAFQVWLKAGHAPNPPDAARFAVDGSKPQEAGSS